MAQRVVGHGELLKALNELPDVTDQRFRIAAMHLAHTKPPDLSAYVKTKTIAEFVGCSARSVELCRSWLRSVGAVEITAGGGRRADGKRRYTTVDFEPLARMVVTPEAGCGVNSGVTPNENGLTPNENAVTPKLHDSVYEKDPLRRTQLKDSAALPAETGARAATTIAEDLRPREPGESERSYRERCERGQRRRAAAVAAQAEAVA